MVGERLFHHAGASRGGAGARGSLVGIGVAGMVPAVVLLDADGAVLRRSIQQSDGRCMAQVEALAREVDGLAFLRRTGNGITQQIVAAKLRWLAAHEPELFGRIATVFGSYDFINWKLTGKAALEHNWALEAGVVDLADGKIAADLVALAGIGPGFAAHRCQPYRDWSRHHSGCRRKRVADRGARRGGGGGSCRLGLCGWRCGGR